MRTSFAGGRNDPRLRPHRETRAHSFRIPNTAWQRTKRRMTSRDGEAEGAFIRVSFLVERLCIGSRALHTVLYSGEATRGRLRDIHSARILRRDRKACASRYRVDLFRSFNFHDGAIAVRDRIRANRVKYLGVNMMLEFSRESYCDGRTLHTRGRFG